MSKPGDGWRLLASRVLGRWWWIETDLAVKAGMLGYVGLLHLQSRAWYLPESQAYIHAGEVMQRADNIM